MTATTNQTQVKHQGEKHKHQLLEKAVLPIIYTNKLPLILEDTPKQMTTSLDSVQAAPRLQWSIQNTRVSSGFTM